MIRFRLLMAAMLVLLLAAPMTAAENSPDKWLDLGSAMVAEAGAEAEAPPAAPAKAPPLPIHTIEGYGGAAITPVAYLVNPGAEGTVVGLPSASYTYVKLGSKDLHAVAVTQTFFRRIELGYAANRFGLGSLDNDIRKALGVDINRNEVWLHHFNVRTLLIEENSFGLPLPAVTAGVHFKYNDTIKKIDRRLGGALQSIGFDKDNGVDYTLTATKMFPTLAFGRPVIITGGLRFSNAAQLGYLGFADEYTHTVEGSIIYLPLDNLAVLYEFRQKENPYDEIDGLIEEEDNWHSISAHWIVNEHMTLSGAWIYAGNIANGDADCGLAIQVKWEF